MLIASLNHSMWVESDAAESKTAIKADPTAPARSAIRRQRTVRYSPNVRDHQSTLSNLLSRNQSRSQGRMRALADRRSLLEDIRRREPSTSQSPNPDDQRDVEAEADQAHTQASQRSRLESGRALLRDALSYERPGRRMRIIRSDGDESGRRTRISQEAAGAWRRPTPGFAPSEADRALREMQRAEDPSFPRPVYVRYHYSPTSEETIPGPRGYMPSPPYTAGDTSNGSWPYAVTSSVGSASLTPRFAPAHRLDAGDEANLNMEREQRLARLATRMAELSDDGEREYVAGHQAEINRMRNRNPAELSPEYREAEAAYLESVETRLNLMRRLRDNDLLSDLPPLRRMRATPGQPQSHIDGLGDRERSFSPDDDQWETMLTTIQPDERVPSAHSSFRSATATASSLSSNSALSSGTMITAPSTSTDAEFCLDDSDDETMDTLDSQLVQAESQARRIQALSDRLSRQQNLDEHDFARHRRWVEREDELHQMEANLRRLERQISEERPAAAGPRRQGRARRERL